METDRERKGRDKFGPSRLVEKRQRAGQRQVGKDMSEGGKEKRCEKNGEPSDYHHLFLVAGDLARGSRGREGARKADKNH